jgi:anti-sigma factor ChrR (cupin superfamily)
MLDRDGGEIARATSIVAYPAGSRFTAHRHELGEEFLVLEGVFADEHGRYPAGTYVRNPPGSSHSPFSDEGCVLFVKLRQFELDDARHVTIDTDSADWIATAPGLSTLALHRHRDERVSLLRLAAGARLADDFWPGGVEILLLSGVLGDGEAVYPGGSWMRWPAGSQRCFNCVESAVLYLKQGHLGESAKPGPDP